MELTVQVPDVAQKAIKELRRECARTRKQRNEARNDRDKFYAYWQSAQAEVERLQAEVAALREQVSV